MKISLSVFSILVAFFCFSLTSWGQVTLTASPSYLSFQAKPGSGSIPKTSVVFYNFYEDMSISLWLNHTCSSDFGISSTCIGSKWNSGSCQVTVDYRPVTAHQSSCTIYVNSNPGAFTSIMVQGTSI